MEFKVDQERFLRAIEAVVPALSKKMELPVFSCVLISTQPGQVTITAADPLVTIRNTFEAAVKVNGSICTAAKPLFESIQLLPSGDVTLALADGRLQVRSRRTVLHFNTMPADQFPVRTDLSNLAYTKTDGLFGAMSKVAFATARAEDENQQVISSVYMGDNEVVGVDGKRLSVQAYPSVSSSPLLIPSGTAQRVAKSFEDKDLGVTVANNSLCFSQAGKFASIRLMDGQFPDYRRVFPTTEPKIVQVSSQDLIHGLKLASLIDPNKSGRPSVSITFGDNTMVLNAETAEVGKFEHVIEAKCSCDLTVGLDIRYLLEATERHTAGTITMEIRSANEPVIITEAGYRNVIMPRRLR
jgi:DNA polymerase-3 subunit beta